ncbi:hypothetical protein [Peribacillus butanolivorans]
MLMVLFRLALIGISLIYLSEIPSTEKVFFNARFAFYGMVFLDFINLYRSNKGFEKHYAAIGSWIIGIITFLDFLGVLDIILLNNGKIVTNKKYDLLLSWCPSIPIDSYIVTFSFITLFWTAAEFVLIYYRNRSANKVIPKDAALDT